MVALLLAGWLGLFLNSCHKGLADPVRSSAPKTQAAEATPPTAGTGQSAIAPRDVDPGLATLAATLGDKGLLPLTPENVTQKLASIAVLTNQGPQLDTEWKFIGTRAQTSVEVSFEKNERGSWAFTSLSLRLKPPKGNLSALFDDASAQLRKRFGKPRRHVTSPPDERAAYWNLARTGLQLALEERVDPDSGPRVQISMFVPQGEVE